jgi:hypothetical protein
VRASHSQLLLLCPALHRIPSQATRALLLLGSGYSRGVCWHQVQAYLASWVLLLLLLGSLG